MILSARWYSKHGGTALMRRLRVSGMDAIDRRYGTARAMAMERLARESAFGGADKMTALPRSVAWQPRRGPSRLVEIDTGFLGFGGPG